MESRPLSEIKTNIWALFSCPFPSRLAAPSFSLFPASFLSNVNLPKQHQPFPPGQHATLIHPLACLGPVQCPSHHDCSCPVYRKGEAPVSPQPTPSTAWAATKTLGTGSIMCALQNASNHVFTCLVSMLGGNYGYAHGRLDRKSGT